MKRNACWIIIVCFLVSLVIPITTNAATECSVYQQKAKDSWKTYDAYVKLAEDAYKQHKKLGPGLFKESITAVFSKASKSALVYYLGLGPAAISAMTFMTLPATIYAIFKMSIIDGKIIQSNKTVNGYMLKAYTAYVFAKYYDGMATSGKCTK